MLAVLGFVLAVIGTIVTVIKFDGYPKLRGLFLLSTASALIVGRILVSKTDAPLKENVKTEGTPPTSKIGKTISDWLESMETSGASGRAVLRHPQA